ncbi:nonstructural protein 1 [Copiparvovirus P229T/pangolin/2018]|nr:nonstructural protein 1 [Copiparvovirus P229T/pangolin/2018]
MDSFWKGVCRLFPKVGDIPGFNWTCPLLEILLKENVESIWPRITDPHDYNAIRQGEALFTELVSECKKVWRGMCDPPIFMQLEKGVSGLYHLHYLISTNCGTPRDMSTIFKTVERRVSEHYFTLKGLVFFNPKKNGHGAWESSDKEFIRSYLLSKLPLEGCIWAWTTMKEEFEKCCLSKPDREDLLNKKPVEELIPKYRGNSGDSLQKLVTFLGSNYITTEESLSEQHPEIYFSYAATNSGSYMLRAALNITLKKILKSKTLSMTLMGVDSEDSLKTVAKLPMTSMLGNKVWQILAMNRYNPDLAAAVFFYWGNKQTGKKNTIYLYGPATTGKTNLAQAICHASAKYGNVNWNNENFPFQDILDCQVGWWEEGKLTAKLVESAKAILGGTKVRVDRKCKTSEELIPPPMIITSNLDMTFVVDGSMVTGEHRVPLQERMIKFSLNQRLDPDFGIITKQEVKDFFTHGAKVLANGGVPDDCYLSTGPAHIPFEIPTTNWQWGSGIRKPLWERAVPDPVQDDPHELDDWFSSAESQLSSLKRQYRNGSTVEEAGPSSKFQKLLTEDAEETASLSDSVLCELDPEDDCEH